ncbi:MAG: threonylcarbamoyl-AMP synthase [Gammaproteobacteria bacterium]|nr:threonylcarbamoyl-AMP synthase [Gammaproteobacteria bacterium]
MIVASPDVRQAAQVMRDGGVIAYATEAVFGLGCDPQNTRALSKLLQLKQRSPHKGLILIAASEQQLYTYLEMAKINDLMWRRARATWPGPVTWLLPVPVSVSSLLRGEHNTLAVRVSAHPQVRELCDAFGGAIVSTSANVSTQPPAKNVDDVMAQFDDQLDFILLGETSGATRPSEIRDAITGQVIRAG